MSTLVLEILAAPLVICLILTGLHAYVGFHVLARGVLFVDLALAQVAAMGSTAALLVGYEHDSLMAYVFALCATFLGAALFSATRGVEGKVSQEAIIGICYAVSAAVAILLVDRAPHGTEHVKEILVGNLLAVSWTDVLQDAPIYAVLGIFHFVLRERFLTISYRPAEAAAKGWRLARWDLLFYMAFGLMITTSVRIAGVLLVFSYLIVPGVIASLLADRLSRRLAIAWAAGGVVTVAGLWGSFQFDFPTGATIVVAFGIALVAVGLFLKIHGRRAVTVAALMLCAGLFAPATARAQGEAATDAATDVDLGALMRALGESQSDGAGMPVAVAPSAAPSAAASLNPSISVVFNVTAADYRGEPVVINEEDPQGTGINQQEIELVVQAVADPYVRADLAIFILGLDEFEIEEGYLTTLDLPAGLQVKAGVFRSAIGRQNGQHVEMLPTVNRPLFNGLLLGADGLRAPGAQLSYLIDWLPFYSVLYVEGFSVGAPKEAEGPLQTFGGGGPRDPAYAAVWENFFELADAWSLLVGLNATTSLSPGLDLESGDDDRRAWLFGGDLYLKWRPLGADAMSRSVALTLEYFARRLSQGDLASGYGQLAVQFARRWMATGRVDYVGGPGGDRSEESARASFGLNFKPTEFSHLRFQVDRAFLGRNETAFFVQLGAGIGPHGAHPF